MRISRDKKISTLQLSRAKNIHKVLERFSISDAKVVRTPLTINNFRLSKEHCPQIDEEKDFMAKVAKVSYASTIGSLTYAMLCTKPHIAYVVGTMSRFMSNLSMQYWEAVKWILRYLQGTTKKCMCFRRSKLKLHRYVVVDFYFFCEIDCGRSTI